MRSVLGGTLLRGRETLQQSKHRHPVRTESQEASLTSHEASIRRHPVPVGAVSAAARKPSTLGWPTEKPRAARRVRSTQHLALWKEPHLGPDSVHVKRQKHELTRGARLPVGVDR